MKKQQTKEAKYMVSKTNEEIMALFTELWKGTTPKIAIELNTPTDVRVRMAAMYEAPGLTFKQLKAISEFFNTEHIDDTDKFSWPGCETCDYGSEYGFTLRIYEIED